MTKKTRIFMTGSAAVLAGGLCTGLVAYYGAGFPALVASTGPTELSYVPADASVVAYADVKSIMHSDLRQRFKQSVPMPMGEEGQKEFYEKTGIDIENDVDYVVAAASNINVPGTHPNGVVVARGRFDIVKLEALAREHGAQVRGYKGKRLLTLVHESSTVDVPVESGTAANPQRTSTPPARPACSRSSSRASSPSATSTVCSAPLTRSSRPTASPAITR